MRLGVVWIAEEFEMVFFKGDRLCRGLLVL